MVEKKIAFTLIELMITISILAILTMVSYAPYNYYQNKAKLRITEREVSQILNEARNMAINGAVGSSGNVSIGVYFDTNSLNNNAIKVFSYPYDIANLNISYIEGGDVKLLKRLVLEKGIQIESIESKSNLLFVFNAITGNLSYYSWAGGIRNSVVGNKISISFSYKGSTSPNLNKTIYYYTSTNIID